MIESINSCMSVQTVDGQVYQNITDLPETDEIQNGDYLIVETPTGTSIINFQNFLIDLDHITFDAVISQHTTDISTLSSAQLSTSQSITANIQNNLNKFMTVGYIISGNKPGVSVNGNAELLPINMIQSNTIDGNFTNASSSLNGVTSGSNTINLNPGSYQVSIYSSFSGGNALLDLYNQTGSEVLLTSDYSTHPKMMGLISLEERSSLYIRSYTSATRHLGTPTSFYVDGLLQMPLVATFQYLSGGTYPVTQPDTRS